MCMLRRATGSPPCSACDFAVTHNLTPVRATSQSTPDLVSTGGSTVKLSSCDPVLPSGLSGLIMGVEALLEKAVDAELRLSFSFAGSVQDSG